MGKISSRFVDGLERSYKKQWLLDLTRNADVTRVNYGHLVDPAGVDATTVAIVTTIDPLLVRFHSPNPSADNFEYIGAIAYRTSSTLDEKVRAITSSTNTATGTVMPALDVDGNPIWSAGENARRDFNTIRFSTDAQKVTLRFDASTDNISTRFRVKVNGRYLNSGAFYYSNAIYTELSWATRDFRTIELELPSGYMQLFGAWTLATDVVKKVKSNGQRVAFVTDSFGIGTGADFSEDAWPVYLSQYLDLSTTLHSTIAGTGLERPGSGTGYNFFQRINDLAIFKPDIVFICASVNDVDYTQRNGTGTLIAATSNYIDTLKTMLPSVEIVYVGLPGRVNPDDILDVGVTRLDVENDTIAGISSSNYADDVVFLPVQTDIGEPLVFGGGNEGNLLSDGNADFYISTDNGHFSTTGQVYFAKVIGRKLLELANT